MKANRWTFKDSIMCSYLLRRCNMLGSMQRLRKMRE